MCPPFTYAAHTHLCIFSFLLHFINHMLLELEHIACCSFVLPLPRLFKLFSMLTTPFLLPIFLHSYRTLRFPGPHCFIFVAVIHYSFHSSSICAFLIVHPPITHSSSICVCLLFCCHFIFCSSMQSMLLVLLLIAILYCSSFGLCK